MPTTLFSTPKPVIGVLQLLPLPGSTGWHGRIHDVISRAEQEATAMATGGVDAILVENTSDMPYPTDRMDVAGAVAMGLIIRRMMHFTDLPIGINVLKNDPETALAIAMNVGARFIRVSLLTGAAISETGLMEGRYAQLMAYQKRLITAGIAVFADLSLERTIPLVGGSGEVTLSQLAQQAMETGLPDALILTDPSLQPPEIAAFSNRLDIPVLYDYRRPLDQVEPYLRAADGLLVSSTIKKSALTVPERQPTVDLTKVEELMTTAELLRTQSLAC